MRRANIEYELYEMQTKPERTSLYKIAKPMMEREFGVDQESDSAPEIEADGLPKMNGTWESHPEFWENQIMSSLEQMRSSADAKETNFTQDGFMFYLTPMKYNPGNTTGGLEIRDDKVKFLERNTTYKLFERRAIHNKSKSLRSFLEENLPLDFNFDSLLPKGAELKPYGRAYQEMVQLMYENGENVTQLQLSKPKIDEEAWRQAELREDLSMQLFMKFYKGKPVEVLNQGFLNAGSLPEPACSYTRRRLQMLSMRTFNVTLPVKVGSHIGDDEDADMELRFDKFQDEILRKPDRPFSLFEGFAGAAIFLSDVSNPAKSQFPFFELEENEWQA
eukprot:CAMPEP_0114488784 /NCGR_PEP_ID=MMETSP0109-20121206/1518_1 /TAXON_ID=29199 /ORGANISM="Chlorarachnion reptans, Strain CCCM449" /LENGTH=332 /DNA_ID=CAMNT_0001665207 /DNA_START=98 /DNA_END=1096 /DNA_ORIENTATION=-